MRISATDFDDAIDELADLHPHVDIDAVMALDLPYCIDIQDVARALIDAGCDPAAVKRILLDD